MKPAGVLMLFACLAFPVTSQETECFDESLKELCINPNATSTLECSGRGVCVCGVCECYRLHSHTKKKYSGKYCECDDYSCDYHFSRMCGGNGQCICGKCVCNEGFVGNACECPTSPDTCLASNGKICNGIGDCECGVCRCHTHTSYRGPTCEECPTCPGACVTHKDCALCVAFQSGQFDKETCERKCKHVETVHDMDIHSGAYPDRTKLCQFQDVDGCRFFFTYQYTVGTEVDVHVLETKICRGDSSVGSSTNNTALATSYSTLGTWFGVVGGIALHRIAI